MGQRIAGFVLRAFHFESDSKEGQALKKEVNGILKKRGALAHGGNFLEPPTADENERLRAIVAAALDLKLAK
jgi:hypothetical protein